MCAIVTAVVLVTYARLDPGDTYHVSRDGFHGGLSRAVTLVNFPIALVVIALVLIAMAALPTALWWTAGPAIALCATMPLFVDQSDLDARWSNAIPALGVFVALGLTVAAAWRVGTALAPKRPWDRWRVVLAGAVVLISLPWITAELGYHFPGDVFMGEESGRESDGTTLAAVHLGHHHGTDGALLVLGALLLSRVAIARARLRAVTFAYLGTMLAYGGVNLAQDAWNEQVVKRGWTDAGIPSALLPGVTGIWAVVVVLAAVATWVLLREQKSYSVQ